MEGDLQRPTLPARKSQGQSPRIAFWPNSLALTLKAVLIGW